LVGPSVENVNRIADTFRRLRFIHWHGQTS
jgi:hypothetical protein